MTPVTPTTDSQPGASSGLSPIVPRPVRSSSNKRRLLAALLAAAVVVAVALLVFNLLGDAALFFYNADEAVERREELGSQRFTVQGTPLAEPVQTFRDDTAVLAFPIGFNGTVMDVLHEGDPPDLFQPGVPVVLEGAWRRGSGISSSGDGWHFASDRMLVKHDNDYRNRDDYEERITDADQGVQQP